MMLMLDFDNTKAGDPPFYLKKIEKKKEFETMHAKMTRVVYTCYSYVLRTNGVDQTKRSRFALRMCS